MDADAIRQRRENRDRFLRRLYAVSEEDASEYLDGYEIAHELGLSRTDAERIVRYFEDHGFVRKVSNHGLTVRITAQGIDFLEAGQLGG